MRNKQHCQKANNEVIATAKDGVEALEKIKQLKPDVVLLDVIMPQLDGLGVLEKVMGSNMPKKPLFIMISAVVLNMIPHLTKHIIKNRKSVNAALKRTSCYDRSESSGKTHEE